MTICRKEKIQRGVVSDMAGRANGDQITESLECLPEFLTSLGCLQIVL